MARYPKQDDPKGKKVMPSVTQIISDCTDSSGPLTQWAANMCKEWVLENADEEVYKPSSDVPTQYIYKLFDHELDEMRFNFRKVSQKALDIGSEVHGLIEEFLNLSMTEDDFDYREWMLSESKLNYKPEVRNAFDAFLQWHDKHTLKPIALEQTVYGNGWAGTLDIHCLLNGVEYVIDWKTSKAHYPMQHGPQIAAYKSCIKTAHGCGILRIDKETGFPDFKDYTNRYEKDLIIFNKMAELYMLRHPRIARKANATN